MSGKQKIADDINQDKKLGFFIDACEPATPLSPFMGVADNDRIICSTQVGFPRYTRLVQSKNGYQIE